MIDHHIKGASLDISGYDGELVEKAQNGFNAFLSWAREVRLTPVASEIPMDSLGRELSGLPVNGGLSFALSGGKESATFTHHHFEALPGAMDAFLHLLSLHQLRTELEGFT
jgi:hypothetical protein